MSEAGKNKLYTEHCRSPITAGFSTKRFLRALILAIIIFIALTYNLSYPAEGQIQSPYESILFRFGSYGFSGNLYTFGIAWLLYLWFSFFGEKELFRSKSMTVLATLFGLLNAAALHLFYRNTLPRHSLSAAALFLAQAAVWALLFLLMAHVLLFFADCIGTSFGQEKTPRNKISRMIERHLFFFAFLIILVGWLPWIISYYPASMEWDVYDPIMRYLGMRPPSSHHPWFYTTVIGAAYQLGLTLGDKNIGVFIYTVLRALVMAAIYARCAVLQKNSGAPRPLTMLTVLFFAVTPVWGAYAKHAFKDSIGAALFCWFVLTLVKIVLELKSERLKAGSCLEYSLAGLLASLFRNNTWYVVLPVTLILFLVFLFKKQKLHFAAVLVLGLLLFEGYGYYVESILLVEPGNACEALSLPLQQTGRTVRWHGDELSEEELDILRKYSPGSVQQRYDPIISDPVKGPSSEEYKTMSDYFPYLKLWLKLFPQFPYTYLEAFIAHSSGYYAFTPEYTEAQRYGPGSHANVGMTIFNWVYDDRFPAEFCCSYNPKMFGMQTALDNWAEIWHQIPILNLTDTKPLYTWSIILLGWLWFRRKEWLKLLPVFACTLMILTCVASPVNDCFRYFAPVAAAFPALLCLLKRWNAEPGTNRREQETNG